MPCAWMVKCMRKQPFARIRGELTIEISGERPERLLNLALREGIRLDEVRHLSAGRLSCRIALPDIYQLRPLARRARCRIRIRQRRGLPFTLAFLRRRFILPLAAALATLLLAFLCSLCWNIRVTSPYDLSEEDTTRILQLAEDQGIIRWRSRWNMDTEAAEEYILDSFPELYYAEIYQHGTALEIHVVKRIDIPEEDRQRQPGNIVAACDGVISDVLVRQGTAAVKSGDTVKKGDVLIWGVFNGQLCVADGIVTANVGTEGYGECSQEETIVQETGNYTQYSALIAPSGAQLVLLGSKEAPYDSYRTLQSRETIYLWRNIPLPVELLLIEMRELTYSTLTHSPAEAQQIANKLAEERAVRALESLECGEPQGEISISHEIIDTEDEIARCRALVIALLRIEDYHELSQEEAEALLHDPPTDPAEEMQ